jgi:serine/threonine protein kinase
LLPPGTRIGARYVIDRLLGQGGMSNLYIATDLTQNNAVRVIKEMTARYPDPNEQKAAEGLFMREAQLLATLNHPHIPKVFDKFIFQGKYYLSMEYVQGEDLGKLITDKGSLEEKLVASYGAQMATVLYYLHNQKPPIVFRDVKPSNIMIVNDQVKLIDFGIARMFTPAKKGDTMRIGSPGYAPPEQYGGQTDPRSDIYALGVTLHHAVTGYDPTISQTPFIIPPARQLNPRVSAEMEAVIARATQLDPDKRYQNTLEMKRDLQNVMRQHGMNVGSSMPFSTVNQPQAPHAPAPPPPGATVPKLPPSMAAAAAGAQAAQGSQPGGSAAAATPVTPTPATPPVAPTPAPNNAAATTARPRKRRGGGAALALLMFFGAIAAVVRAPAEWRNRVWQQLSSMVAALPLPGGSKTALSDGEKVLLFGGPLPVAVEELGKEVRAGKATPEQRLTYQNALAYASGKPVKLLSVLTPADYEVGENLARWQRLSWDRTDREGTLLVIAWQKVEAKDWRAAVRRSLSGEQFREGKKPSALLVVPPASRPSGWAGWFEKAPAVYWGGAVESGDPAGVKKLELPAPDYARVLRALEFPEVLWLAKSLRAPGSIKAEEFPGPEGIAKLLKLKAKPLLVIDPAQLQGLSSWPKVEGVRLLTVYAAGTLPAKAPQVPAGFRFFALTQGSPFHPEPQVARYFDDPDAHPEVYDHLAWAGSDLLGLTRQQGLSWRTDRNGALSPGPWTLLEARNTDWHWVRDAEDR